ncbi:MAG: adenine deaminase C-terminal domain-containing protein [Actinomycetota bacterium]
MNFRGTVAGDEDMIAKIAAAHRAGRHIDGHAPGLSGRALCAYLASGARSEHEATRLEEALEKRRLGMWIMIREGTATRNARALMPLVLEYGPRNCMLVTDDREPHHIRQDGHVNDVIRLAVSMGVPAEDAVVMATLHPAQRHRLWEHGAVAPGYVADVVAVEGLESFRPLKVWKWGRLVAEEGTAIGVPEVSAPDWMRGSVKVRRLFAEDFRIGPADGRVRVIQVVPYELYTRTVIADPSQSDGQLVADPSRDLAKVSVVERHKETGRIGRGLVTGFGLQRGAIASTHAHDAHNVVVIGVNDDDMAVAVNRLVEIGGGQVVVDGGRVLAEVPCPIAGLLSDLPFERVADAMEAMERAAADLGVTLPYSFMAMSLLALSVLPELRLTDRGLVDVNRFELVPLEA